MVVPGDDPPCGDRSAGSHMYRCIPSILVYAQESVHGRISCPRPLVCSRGLLGRVTLCSGRCAVPFSGPQEGGKLFPCLLRKLFSVTYVVDGAGRAVAGLGRVLPQGGRRVLCLFMRYRWESVSFG